MFFLLSQEIHEIQELRQKSSSKILQEDHANPVHLKIYQDLFNPYCPGSVERLRQSGYIWSIGYYENTWDPFNWFNSPQNHIFWDHNIKKTRHRLWRSVSWTPFSKTLYPPQNRYSTLDTKEYFEQSLLESYRINCVFVFVSLHSSAKRPKSFWNMFSSGLFHPHQSLHATFYTDTARKSQEALQVGIQLHQMTDHRATLKSFDAASFGHPSQDVRSRYGRQRIPPNHYGYWV